MNANKNLLAGKKFNGRHTTYLDDSEEMIKTLKAHPQIKTISLGEIKSLRVTSREKRSVKCSKIQGGMLITFRGFNGRQLIRVYLVEQGKYGEIEGLVKKSL